MGQRYSSVCFRAFQSVYDITKYKRKILLSQVKRGIKNSDKELTHWSRVHDSTLESVTAFLKSENNEFGFTVKEILVNICLVQIRRKHIK